MSAVLLYALLSTAAFYLGSRATITSWLWTRYPRWLVKLADCAACSGFHYGAIVAAVFRFDVFGLSGWATIPVVALSSMIWTPLLAALHQMAMDRLGSAVTEEESDDS